MGATHTVNPRTGDLVEAARGLTCKRESGIEPLAAAGVPIWIDARARIATMVIDGAVTLTGSMSWTRGGAVNSEDLNLISSPAIAAAYAAHWFPEIEPLRR
jgi:hypothetical protein